MNLKQLGIAAAAALTIAGSAMAPATADAAPAFHGGGFHGGAFHGGGFHRGYGGFGFAPFAFGAGLAFATAPYAYGYDNCWIQHRVVFDRWGRRIVRPVEVCGY